MNVGSYEAKTKLPQLLEMASRGESITVTRHGVPIAMIVPAPGNRMMTKEQLVEAIMAHRKGRKLGPGVKIKDLINEGRKY